MESNGADPNITTFKIRRVTIEGESTNVLLLRQSNFELIPIMNAPPTTSLITNVLYKEINILFNYNYFGQPNAIRVITV